MKIVTMAAFCAISGLLFLTGCQSPTAEKPKPKDISQASATDQAAYSTSLTTAMSLWPLVAPDENGDFSGGEGSLTYTGTAGTTDGVQTSTITVTMTNYQVNGSDTGDSTDDVLATGVISISAQVNNETDESIVNFSTSITWSGARTGSMDMALVMTINADHDIDMSGTMTVGGQEYSFHRTIPGIPVEVEIE